MWFLDLLTQSTIAHAILLYAFVIAFGVILGKVKIFGVSLGVTFVLFVGIIVGQLYYSFQPDAPAIDPGVLHFIKEFGLILFIFSIGIQVGPGFFSSFKKGGIVLNGLAMLIVGLDLVVALIIYFGVGNINITDLVGVLSGAVTNTPGLGAAQQTLNEVNYPDAANAIKSMSMGYAAAYPLGVVGIILSMILVKIIFKINLADETKTLEAEKEESQLKPYMITVEVTNRLIHNMPLARLISIIDRNFVISRMKKSGSDEIIIPTSKTIISEGDLLYMVISAQDEEAFVAIIGPKIEMDWKTDEQQGPVVSRRIVVTNHEYSGRKIGSLRLHMGYKLNATRVNRAGVDLLASPNLSLQVGDRITVVGNIDDINRLAEKMGNSMKRLNQPNMFTMFVGILMGIIVGSIPIAFPGMSVPMKLGLAGGPLIVAILMSRWGYKIKLITYTSTSASMMLREVGICLFLASVGIGAGENFIGTVFNSTGEFVSLLLWHCFRIFPAIVSSLIQELYFWMETLLMRNFQLYLLLRCSLLKLPFILLILQNTQSRKLPQNDLHNFYITFLR
mgnify:CR=1 FL=1